MRVIKQFKALAMLAVIFTSDCASVSNAQTVPTNLIVNGSFESPTRTGNYNTDEPVGWFSGTIAHAFVFAGQPPFWPIPEDGAQYVDIGNRPDFQLSQYVTTITAATYVLNWFDSTGDETLTSPYMVTLQDDNLQFLLSTNLDANHVESAVVV